MRIKRLLGFCLGICLLTSALKAVPPTWSVNGSQYQYSMTVVALLKVSSSISNDEQDIVGAFQGAEVRGVGSPNVRVASTGQLVIFLQVYSNTSSGETITFKIFDQSNDVEIDAVNQLTFQNNASFGSNTVPYIITDNRGPTDIRLDTFVVDENSSIGTTLGTLSAVDEDAADTFAYTLVSGDGDTDNGSFGIDGANLETAAVLDHETQSQFSVRIRATDNKNEFFEKVFTLQAKDVNEVATDVQITPALVAENSAFGTMVGMFSASDQDEVDAHTFTLVAGDGDTDNAHFLIREGTALVVNAALDFEAKASQSIRVRVTDLGYNTLEKALSIQLENANESPTDLGIDENTISENSSLGHVIGTFSPVDEDNNDGHTYVLRNHSEGIFDIQTDQLVLARKLNFEDRNFYFLDVLVRDEGEHEFQKRFRIDVTDENDAPTDIGLSLDIVSEDRPLNFTFAQLSTTDEDRADTFTYTLAAGEGDDNNASFLIDNEELKINVALDFETQHEYSCRIRSTDAQGAFVEKSFVIRVRNVNEPPTALSLTRQSISEERPLGSVVGVFQVSDQDTEDRHSYRFVSGANDGDNENFVIERGELKTKVALDFETQATHKIRVQVSDNASQVFVQTFDITVSDGNDAPTAIRLSNASVDENSVVGTLIGTLSVADADETDVATYALSGGADDGKFSIQGNELRTQAILDYESNIFYSLIIQAQDREGAVKEQSFVVQANDVNEPPVGIEKSQEVIRENVALDTIIGHLSTVDPDHAENFTYALSDTEPPNDNDYFVVKGSRIHNKRLFNYEDKPSLQIRLTATDKGGLTFSQDFIVILQDVPEIPTNIRLTNTSIDENLPPGTIVGNLVTQDPDSNDDFEYALVSGVGANDNGSFYIFRDQLLTARAFDHETQASLQFLVGVTDNTGYQFQKILTLLVNDVNDPPSRIVLTGGSVQENNKPGLVIGSFDVQDQDEGDSAVFQIIESADPNAFAINSENELVAVKSLDFETQPTLSLQIKARDSGSLFIKQDFTILLEDVNDAPNDILLSSQTLAENAASGSKIAVLSVSDPDDDDSFTFQFASSGVPNDNTKFTIDGDKLLSNQVFNYEERKTYQIHLRALDDSKVFVEKTFTLTVEDLNDPPKESRLTTREVREDMPAGTLIGVFSTIDEDENDTFQYQIVEDVNTVEFFEIRKNELYIRKMLDAETQDTFDLRVRTTDQGRASTNNVFKLSVVDANDPPELKPTGFSVKENSPNGTSVGRVVAEDPEEGQKLTFSISSVATEATESLLFAIHPTSGELTVSDETNLDYEKIKFQRVRVFVFDDQVPALSDTLDYKIEIEDVVENFVPANLVVTPNQDGINDYWVVQNVELYKDLTLIILSSHGQVVYQAKPYDNTWDGTFNGRRLPKGAYHYLFKHENGDIAQKGTFSILY